MIQLLKSFYFLLSPSRLKEIKSYYSKDETTHLLVLIIVGTIPTAIIGVFLKDFLTPLFGSLGIVGCTLMITGILLAITRFISGTSKDILEISLFQAVLIGFVQGLAITPGISRSGSTIAVALFLGINRETSGRFSFLLSIPAILGATILNFGTGTIHSSDFLPLIFGTISAFVSGYISLTFLLRMIKKGRFHQFAPYCLVLGAATLCYAIVS